MSERQPQPERPRLTEPQEQALGALCQRYGVEYVAEHYAPVFDLPPGWVAGFVGGQEIQKEHPTLYVGCSPEGSVHS